jgi:hypothetical protein
MNDYQYQVLLALPAAAAALYFVCSLGRDIHNWLENKKENEQLGRATQIEEGNKHYYLIRKTAPKYEILVDEELIGTAETLQRAHELGEREVRDRNMSPADREAYKRTERLISGSED